MAGVPESYRSLEQQLAQDALFIVWLHPDYRYSYQANVCGKGLIWLTLRRQLRALNACSNGWYRRWRAHNQAVYCLDEIYWAVLGKSFGLRPIYMD